MAHTLSPALIRDYDLFSLAVAHHDELQRQVGSRIHAHGMAVGRPLKVLELGTGTGLTTLQIVLGWETVHVTTVELEPAMVHEAKRRLAPYRSVIDFVTGDMRDVIDDLPADYDALVSAFTLHHLSREDWPALLRNVAAKLRAGALFLNADKIARNDPREHANDLQEQLAAFAAFAAIGRPDLQAEWHAHYVHDDQQRLTEHELMLLLAEAGFDDFSVTWRCGMDVIVEALRGGAS